MKMVYVLHKSTIPGWIKAVKALRREYKLRLARKITGARPCVLCAKVKESHNRCKGTCPWWWFTGDGCGLEAARLRWANNQEWATRRIKELGEWKAKLEEMK